MNIVEILAIPLMIQLYANQFYDEDLSKTMVELASEVNVPKIQTYDFIIVGGGTAGCVLAGRLSREYSLGRILLLEAGGTPPPSVTVPYFTGMVAQAENINSVFHSVKMNNAALGRNGIVRNSVGKMLGGSGSHNGMLHNRGSPKDFDNWAEITKDDSWNYSNVLQYFKKSENFIGHLFGNDNTSSEYFGKDGPITIDSTDIPFLPLWLAAGKELGYNSYDPNGFQKEGFSPKNKAIDRGRRMSSFAGYVEKWETDPLNTGHLTVIRYANVSKILLDNNNRAYGVVYTRHGHYQIAHASKEIILSAGAISSPLLLMKSGIGPLTLMEAGISVKVPLNSVGRGLSDHPVVYVGPFDVKDAVYFPRFQLDELGGILEDYHNGDGLLADVFSGAQCFLATSHAEKGWPNVWIEFNHPTMTDDEPQIVKFFVILGRPKSLGELTLNTEAYKNGIRDDSRLVLYDPTFLSHPDDVQAMLEGIKFVFKIAENTTTFRNLNTQYGANNATDACKAFPFRTDEYWRCYIRQNTGSWNHLTGTCRMGPDSDTSDMSVVDSKFRVRGVQNLRVVDASIMPVITNANINAAVIMIAEKAAHEIHKTWNTHNGL